MAVIRRSELDPGYQWDLTPIFETKEAFEQALSAIAEQLPALEALPGTLARDAESLRAALDLVFRLLERLSRVECYASLLKAGDASDPASCELSERTDRVATDLFAAIAFIRPELLAMEPERLQGFMQGEGLKRYRRYVSEIVRARAHTLSAAEERLLAMQGDMYSTPDTVYSMLTDVDMQLPDITLPDGTVVPLTHGTYGMYRENADRDTRRNVFERYMGAYAALNHTMAAIYAGSVKQDCFYARARGYAGALEASLFDDSIPTALYDSLIAAVHAGFPVMKRYLELRRRVLGLDTLHMYDLYVPIVEDIEYHVTYEEACRIVRSALEPLGSDYAALLDRAFSERWIDVYENAGKTSGAFSEGVYGVHSYILLNFTGTLNDVYTLAHELGHAMHSMLSDAAQDYPEHDYTLFVAEVASTVNEMLLSRYLLRTLQDKRLKALVLNHLLEGFRTTMFRQTLFAEFELRAHRSYEQGVPITPELLNSTMLELDRTYYEGVTVDEHMGYEWSVIPHFYRAYYVYQYATGFASAVALSERILEHGGLVDYLRFLTTGGSMDPIDELKLAGVDLTTTAPVDAAIAVFADSIDRLEALLREL